MQNISVFFLDNDVDWKRYCFQKLIFLWSSLFIDKSFLCYNCFFFRTEPCTATEKFTICDRGRWWAAKSRNAEIIGTVNPGILRTRPYRKTHSITHSFATSVTCTLTPGLLMQARASLQQPNLQPPHTPIRSASPSSLGFLQHLDNPSTASSVRELPGEFAVVTGKATPVDFVHEIRGCCKPQPQKRFYQVDSPGWFELGIESRQTTSRAGFHSAMLRHRNYNTLYSTPLYLNLTTLCFTQRCYVTALQYTSTPNSNTSVWTKLILESSSTKYHVVLIIFCLPIL